MSKLDTVKAIITAWSNKDIEAVIDFVSDDITFFYAIGRAPARGKVEMQALLEQLKGHQSDLNSFKRSKARLIFVTAWLWIFVEPYRPNRFLLI